VRASNLIPCSTFKASSLSIQRIVLAHVVESAKNIRPCIPANFRNCDKEK
jgi:hypothetical protein